MINFSELKAHPRYTCAAIMLMIAIWGSAYWAVKIESNRIHEGAIEKAENFSKFFEDQTLKIFHYADSYVKLIRLEYQDHGDLDKIKILMQEAPLDTSMASHVTIIDENGTPVLVSGHKIKPGSSAKDREYFKFQKQAQKDSLFISNAHTGRNTGKTTLRLVRHIIKSNGDFGGVVFAAVEDKQIVAFFNALNMDENSSATLVGTDKLIRARTSYGQVGPGQDISGSRIWKELEQSPSGVYLQKSVVDQITRYYAYRKLDKFPMVIAIGMLTEEILDNISEFKYTAIVIASLLSIAFLILFILIRREALANSKIQKANAEVMAANLAKSEFLAHMSHELRTPLNSIIGFSQVMGSTKFKKSLEYKYVEYSNDILSSGEHLLGVINDILDLSKIEVGEMYLNEEDFGLSEIVLQCNQIMSLKAKNVGIEINISNQAKDILVNADRRYITQIILNLMSNSLKYTHKGGEINITFDKTDDGCPYVEIEDNGAGISKSDLTIILEPFRQARSNAAISHEGTGLGLSLCVKLIELHGGSLNIESVLGKGTSVTVMLPANRLVKDNSAPKEKTDSVLKLESVF